MNFSKDGFEKLGDGKVVMHSTEGLTRGAHKLDPYSTPNIKTFGAKSDAYIRQKVYINIKCTSCDMH